MQLIKSISAILLSISTSLYGQDINVSWKRPLHIQDDLYSNYVYRPFQLLDFYVEKPLATEYFTVGAELIYANYHPDSTGAKRDYYDRSASMGLIVRAYSAPYKIRGFVELGIHGNYLWVNQLISIPHAFGVYEEVVSNEQFEMSATIATGISLGGSRFRWEPYIQYGQIGKIEKMWKEQFITGSVGRVRKNSKFGWIISPLAFKIMIGETQDKK